MIDAKKVRLLYKIGEDYYLLAQIIWDTDAGGESLYMQSPYFSETNGALRHFTIDGPAGTEGNINFAEEGTTVTRRVKYSHHSDGRASFSQAGQVVTRIISNTRPLVDINGHLFSLYVWGLHGLVDYVNSQVPQLTGNQANICVGSGDKYRAIRRQAVTIHGYIYSRNATLSDSGLSTEQLLQPVDWRSGSMIRRGTLITPPANHNSDLCLGIGVFRHRERYVAARPKLVMLGGFNETGSALDPKTSASGIAVLCGVDNFVEISRTLGSSDYNPNSAHDVV